MASSTQPSSSNATMGEEERLKPFLTEAPEGFPSKEEIDEWSYEILCRNVGGTEAIPEVFIYLEQNSNNRARVYISQTHSCDCGHDNENSLCEHVIYVLVKVLRLPWELSYQQSLLISELQPLAKLEYCEDCNGGFFGNELGGMVRPCDLHVYHSSCLEDKYTIFYPDIGEACPICYISDSEHSDDGSEPGLVNGVNGDGENDDAELGQMNGVNGVNGVDDSEDEE